jgi:hypothetical protein
MTGGIALPGMGAPRSPPQPRAFSPPVIPPKMNLPLVGTESIIHEEFKHTVPQNPCSF